MTDLLRIKREGHVTTLTLNRPDNMNPLGASGDGDAFAAACDAINGDIDVRCVILTGAGRLQRGRRHQGDEGKDR